MDFGAPASLSGTGERVLPPMQEHHRKVAIILEFVRPEEIVRQNMGHDGPPSRRPGPEGPGLCREDGVESRYHETSDRDTEVG